jgi:hypothetical protein
MMGTYFEDEELMLRLRARNRAAAEELMATRKKEASG